MKLIELGSSFDDQISFEEEEAKMRLKRASSAEEDPSNIHGRWNAQNEVRNWQYEAIDGREGRQDLVTLRREECRSNEYAKKYWLGAVRVPHERRGRTWSSRNDWVERKVGSEELGLPQKTKFKVNTKASGNCNFTRQPLNVLSLESLLIDRVSLFASRHEQLK